MYQKTRYLEWARRFYGRVAFDLASSGTPIVSRAELGEPATNADDPAGWRMLRDAIARYNDVPGEECIAALGASHAIWLVYATLLGPGDDVLVEEPGYEPLLRAAEGASATVRRFERRLSGGYAIDPARIATSMTPQTKLVAVTNLHNPSGTRTSDDVLRELARVTAQRGAHLLVDEVYAPFDDFVDARGTFTGTARRLGANVVVASSLTKCFGLGNDRFGWVIGPADIIERANDVITATCGMLPLSHAHAAAHAFARIDMLAARARRLLGSKRERVAEWMAARSDLTYSAPTSGLFGFAVVHGAGDITARIEDAAEKQGVLVAAGSFFGVPNGFRVAWSIDEARLAEGLSRLRSMLV